MANETEWFAGRSVEEKHERDYLRRILVGSLLAVFFCWALIYAAATHAAPRYQLAEAGVVITIYDEPCELKEAVINLPNKATWTENGQTYQGCFTYVAQLKIFMFWFSDKTVAVAPVGMFRPVTGV